MWVYACLYVQTKMGWRFLQQKFNSSYLLYVYMSVIFTLLFKFSRFLYIFKQSKNIFYNRNDNTVFKMMILF